MPVWQAAEPFVWQIIRQAVLFYLTKLFYTHLVEKKIKEKKANLLVCHHDRRVPRNHGLYVFLEALPSKPLFIITCRATTPLGNTGILLTHLCLISHFECVNIMFMGNLPYPNKHNLACCIDHDFRPRVGSCYTGILQQHNVNGIGPH